MISSDIKKDFPIFKQSINGNPLVYLDSAATSQKPQHVVDAVQEFYTTYNANVRRGLYPLAEKATQKIEEVRKKVARFINAQSHEEIIFVRNSTEAINVVAQSFMSHNLKKGQGITTSIMEHHSNFVPWQQMCFQKKSELKVIDIGQNGYLDIQNLESKIQHSKLLAISHVSNVLGTINPVQEIIKKVKKIKKDITIVVDSAQSVPHMKIDAQEMGCDFLAFSGHKMLAGTGIGVLYGKKKLLEQMPPFLFGSDMIQEVYVKKTIFNPPPSKFEAGTPDIAGIVSLGAAIDYLENIGMETIQKHEQKLISYCLSRMSQIIGISIYGPTDIQHRAGIISFNLVGIHPHDIAHVLGDLGICIRAGHHCAMPLHNRLGVPASARISFYLYNNKEDIDRFIKGMEKIRKIFKLP